jgi:exodeoxyribonuclease-5
MTDKKRRVCLLVEENSRHSARLSDNSWARIVDLDLAKLAAIDPADLGPEIKPPSALAENNQSSGQFAEEAKRIANAVIPLKWHRPSLHEADAPQPEPPMSALPPKADMN